MEDTASVADSTPDTGADAPEPSTSVGGIGGDAPSPSADTEEETADSILSKAAEEYDSGKGKPVEQTKAAAAPSADQAPTEGEEEPADQPFEPVVETEQLKKAWKSLQKWHPDVAKPLRDSWFKTKAYEENFTVPEVRELRQLFDTPQAAREARMAHADLLAADDALHNRPVDLLQYIAKQSPQGFSALAKALPQTFYQMNPQAYRENVSEPAVKHYHQFFEQYANQTGDEDLKAAIEIIKDRDVRWRGNGGQQVIQQGGRQPGDPILQRLQELEAQNAQAIGQATQAFKDTVDTEFQGTIASEIGKIIDRSGADLSDAGRQEIVNRTMDDVIDGILQDPVLQRQLSWATRPGAGRDANLQRQVVERLAANSKRFLGSSAAKHLRWLTEQIVGASQKQLNKQSGVRPHKEVTGALPRTPSGGGLSKKQLAEMTPDQIIDAAANGLL